jgi:hypothetical protein
VLDRIHTIFKDTLEISRQGRLGDSMDPARYEDLLIQMAVAYSHIPEINIGWLEQLSHHHQKVQFSSKTDRDGCLKSALYQLLSFSKCW